METNFFCRIFLVFFCRNPVGRDMMARNWLLALQRGLKPLPEMPWKKDVDNLQEAEKHLWCLDEEASGTQGGAPKTPTGELLIRKRGAVFVFFLPNPSDSSWIASISFPSCARESGLFFSFFCGLSFLGVELGETRRRPAKPKNSWSHVVPNTIVEPLWWQNAHFRTFSSFGEGKKKSSTQKRSNPPIFARTLGWIKLLAFLNTALFSLYLLSNSFLIIFAEFSFPCGVPLYNGLQGSRQL